ncbi:hypothetical protein BDW59DRAFT_160099 [Aspergillus cavernicola]|uniref:Arrestin-like N-terminal domain-containing protein n=1 Tax=Aspergillus cavernicola TaxID=176166 RepID=A0ABR4IJ43_9EURO
MGIYLDLREFDSEKMYTPSEPVRGLVLLRLDRSTVISYVTLSIEGSARTSLVKKGPAFILGSDTPMVADESHQLLKLSKTLFPRANIPGLPGGYTLSEGEYAFPFEIGFPLQSQCSKHQPELRHILTVLPPSFEAHAAGEGGVARIEYILRIDVKRPGRFKEGTSIQRKLLFTPSDPAPHLMPLSGSGYYGRHGALYINNLAKSLKAAALYTPGTVPILLLEGRLPSPPILYPDETLPLHLFVRCLPTQMEYILPVTLRSLVIALDSTITVTAGTCHTSWTSSRKLLNLKGLKEVVSGVQGTEILSEINNSILQNVTIPMVTPSFTTCTVEQKYSLNVDAGFSLGVTTKLRPIKVVMNVEIWSRTGPRKELYSAISGDLGRSEGSNLLVPLRPRCLAHLGAVEAAAEDRGPPPPYS